MKFYSFKCSHFFFFQFPHLGATGHGEFLAKGLQFGLLFQAAGLFQLFEPLVVMDDAFRSRLPKRNVKLLNRLYLMTDVDSISFEEESVCDGIEKKSQCKHSWFKKKRSREKDPTSDLKGYKKTKKSYLNQ